jgi:AcrR family transcriptional regulator
MPGETLPAVAREFRSIRPRMATPEREVVQMPSARRQGTQDTEARTALLDAAEQLMLEEGYASVTSRRVAKRAGVHAALVHYYFGPMDDLFIAVFQRRAEWMVERQAEALSSAQPLWALWDLTHEQAATALNLEFLALGNHRKAIRTEIASYSKKFRRMQIDALSSVLERYGLDPEEWPPMSVIVAMFGISRFLLMEEAYDLDLGHTETVAVVERLIRRLEGERLPAAHQPLRRGRA